MAFLPSTRASRVAFHRFITGCAQRELQPFFLAVYVFTGGSVPPSVSNENCSPDFETSPYSSACGKGRGEIDGYQIHGEGVHGHTVGGVTGGK